MTPQNLALGVLAIAGSIILTILAHEDPMGKYVEYRYETQTW